MVVTATAVPAGPALLAWTVDPLTVAGLGLAASAYAAGIVRVRHAGGRVPRGAVWAWFGGVAVAAIALTSPIDTYADVSFSVHMVQHVLLTLAAPPLLALGAPITLALRALRPPAARRLSSVLRSPLVAFVTSPVVAWAVFVGVPWAIHVSPLFDAALRSSAWHALEHALWVASALLLWWPVVGADPTPHPWSYPTRLLALFLAMPAASFLSLAIFSASAPWYPTYASAPPPWGPGALASQRDAAVVMWLLTGLGQVVAMLFVAAAWKRHDDARQRRLEARLDAASGAVAP